METSRSAGVEQLLEQQKMDRGVGGLKSNEENAGQDGITGGRSRNVAFESYIVYISRDNHCVGSREILDKLNNVAEDMRVVYVEDLVANGVDFTQYPWLRGTPTIVDNRTEKRLAFSGSSALNFVETLLRNTAVEGRDLW